MECSIPACHKKSWCRKMCTKHYVRWQRYGDPLAPLRKRAHGTGGITPNGYHMITVESKRVFVHRHVMEQHLKRHLDVSEIVHHKNHDKLDNRLSNLELTTRKIHPHFHPHELRPDIKDSDIAEAYSHCHSMQEIGRHYSISPTTVRNRLIRAGVQTRPSGWNFRR